MKTYPDPRNSGRFTLSAFATKWMGRSVEVGIVPVLVLLALYLPFAYFVIPESNALHLSLFGINLIGQIMCFALLALALDLVWGYAGILSLGHGIFFGIGGVHGFELGLRFKYFAQARFDFLAHGFFWIELRFLRQVADVQARHRHGFALDVGVETGHDFQQRRLARAVQAQHADLGAREKTQADIAQDNALGWHDLANPVHGENELSHR